MNETPELFPTSASSRDKPPGKIGGCVGTFLQLFDWNPRKRLFSTKRLPAERRNARKGPGSPGAARKKYKDERMPVAKLLLLAEEENRGGFPSPKKVSSVSSADRYSEDGSTVRRVPGVVARLMGLESMPDERVSDGRLSPQHPKALPPVEVRPLQELLHTRQEPVLLSDLLREREYLEAQKSSLKDRLQVPVPGFAKKLPEAGGGPQVNYMPPKDGFKKSVRNDPHLQPYADQKYHKSLRPLKRTSRDLTDSKHLILALSPRSNGDGLRPILLPSKVHNKLMNSPIKSPTKMGSRSARLLEAAVKILEPSLQPSATRSRAPPARPSSVREFKDLEREAGMGERREKKVASTSNAARVLKGQNMSKSWNGREEAGRYSSGSSLQDSSGGRKRNEQSQVIHTRTASPVRIANRSRSTSRSSTAPQEDTSMKGADEMKTVVPQGFEEAYGGGLKPLNVGRREEMRLDKYEVEDSRRVSEKHIISSLSSLSSLSVGNSPYSECSERSTTSSFQDPLRRSGSAKEGPSPATPSVSKSRFMRSKSVKEEKSSTKLSGGSGGGAQGSHHSRVSARERVKQEIPPQAHQIQQQAHQAHRQAYQQVHQANQQVQQANEHDYEQAHEQAYPQEHEQARQQVHEQAHQQAYPQEHEKAHEQAYQQAHEQAYQKAHEQAYQQEHEQAHQPSSPLPAAPAVTQEPTQSEEIERTPERDSVPGNVAPPTGEEAMVYFGNQEQEVPMVHKSPRASSPEVEVSATESFSSGSTRASSASHLSSAVSTKDAQVPPRSNNGGGILSYSRLFGSRKSGDRKNDAKEKNKARGEAPRRIESLLVRSLLRRKSAPQSPTSPTPGPVQSMDKPKKRGGKKYATSEPASRDVSDAETRGYYSEDYKREVDFDMAAVIEANKFAVKDKECKERVMHPDVEVTHDSKGVDNVFPKVPLDKGCLRLLDDMDGTGSKRLGIEGFDCVEDDSQDRIRGGILNYAAQLMDDLKLEEMFSTGTVIQGSGRNGFSYSPLVELEEPSRSSLESFILEGGVDKCVSFLGRTGDASSSPEMSFDQHELIGEEPEEAECELDKPMQEQQSRTPLVAVNEPIAAAIDDAKEKLLNELSEARKIVDNAFEEATERVAKKLASKGRVALASVDGSEEAVCASAVGNDECGQPSPVSVLDCTFEEDESRSSQGNLHESICETEEMVEFDEDDQDSLIDDLLYESATTVAPTRKERKARKVVSTLTIATDTGGHCKTQTEKIVDAILDISRIRCIDPSACGLVVENSESFLEEEADYVRKILAVWEGFPEVSGNGAAANSELPINSTLFDRLESQGRALAWKREKEREEFGSPSPEAGYPPVRSLKQWQGLWLHRRLLFDCVNETLAYSLKFKYPEPWMGIPILRPPPTGNALVKEVYSDMKDWRDVQTEELDTIIEMDMGRGFGNWSNLNQEIGEIGLEIERTLLRVMIEELVSEIIGVTSLASKCHSISV